jgi:hypothetical protein
MLSTLVNSGRYRGIERSNAFLAEVEKEHVRQRSGDIDDSQISELGKQFGVKFVCIADITPAFGAYQVSARIINVETAEVPFIGDASSPLKTMDDLEQVSVEVVRKMLYFAGESGGARAAQQQQPTVVVIQQPAPQTKEPKVRKHDWYIAPKIVLLSTPVIGALDVEWGGIWGKGTFFGIEFVLGGDYLLGNFLDENSRSTIGGGFSLGGVYNLPAENLQLAYGGSAGVWYAYNERSGERDEMGYFTNTNYRYDGDINFLAPFIKLRWKFVELSYRVGLLGYWERKDENNYDNGYGFSNHQVMLGVHFATSERVGR